MASKQPFGYSDMNLDLASCINNVAPIKGSIDKVVEMNYPVIMYHHKSALDPCMMVPSVVGSIPP